MADKPINGQAGEVPSFPIPMAFNFEQLMELNRPALTAMAEVNGKVYENLSTLNKTWVSFVNRRLKEDLAVPQQLASCKNLQDMMGVYRGFFQNAIADYQAEIEELSKLGKSMTEETVAAVQSRFEETAREARNGVRR
ncbi:MAG: phasin family protein [Hyphomicrobiaceae bacterium]|nr:phasin family protein [Hyphomicrobiaceae bacterium]